MDKLNDVTDKKRETNNVLFSFLVFFLCATHFLLRRHQYFIYLISFSSASLPIFVPFEFLYFFFISFPTFSLFLSILFNVFLCPLHYRLFPLSSLHFRFISLCFPPSRDMAFASWVSNFHYHFFFCPSFLSVSFCLFPHLPSISSPNFPSYFRSFSSSSSSYSNGSSAFSSSFFLLLLSVLIHFTFTFPHISPFVSSHLFTSSSCSLAPLLYTDFPPAIVL